MIKNVKFVVSCQNVNTHAVSTLRSNAEQLPSCEWTAYEILSTIACSFFRLASMKKKYFVSRLQLSRGVISLMNLKRVRLVSILDLVMNRSNLRESPQPSIILYRPVESSLFSIAPAGGIQIQWKVQYTRRESFEDSFSNPRIMGVGANIFR